jgi:hypothetical protein
MTNAIAAGPTTSSEECGSWLTSKTTRAIIRDPKLRKQLLSRRNGLSEIDYTSFDLLVSERRDLVSDQIIETLEAWAPFQLCYPSPIEQYPHDVKIFGTRGIYMVRTQEGETFFSNRRSAIRFADSLSKVSWQLAEAEGLLDPDLINI